MKIKGFAKIRGFTELLLVSQHFYLETLKICKLSVFAVNTIGFLFDFANF